MANYSNLKAAINAVIKQNGQGEITGEVMNQVLTAMVNSLGSNYLFAGVATPSTNPGTPDQNVFYMATQAGTYTNFNAIVLQAGISILLWNGSWSSETFFEIDSVPTSGSGNFISSGAVFDKFKLDGGAYDVSAHNNNQTFASLSALLNDANLPTLIPTNIRSGGMSIKFIQSSDNKYVSYIFVGTSTDVANFTNISNWEKTNLENEVIKIGFSSGLFRTYTVENKGLNKNTGEISTINGITSTYTDIVKCKEGDKFVYKGYSSALVAGWVFYNNGVFVTSGQNSGKTTITVPSGVNEVRFCSFEYGTDTPTLEVFLQAYLYKEITKQILDVSLEVNKNTAKNQLQQNVTPFVTDTNVYKFQRFIKELYIPIAGDNVLCIRNFWFDTESNKITFGVGTSSGFFAGGTFEPTNGIVQHGTDMYVVFQNVAEIGNIIASNTDTSIGAVNNELVKNPQYSTSIWNYLRLDLKALFQYISPITYTEHNGYLTNTGEYVGGSSYHSLTTSKIPCKENDVFLYKGAGAYSAVSVLFYNGNNIVGNYKYNTPSDYTQITIPNGVDYVVFSSFAASGTDVIMSVLIKNPISTPYLEERINTIKIPDVLYGKSVIWDGDSIAAGAGYTGGYGKIIADRNGMTSNNVAVSGGSITKNQFYYVAWKNGSTIYYTKPFRPIPGTTLAYDSHGEYPSGNSYTIDAYNSENNTITIGGVIYTYSPSDSHARHWVCESVKFLTDVDYYILEGGVNDMINGVPLGELSNGFNATLDEETFYGAFESMIKTIYENHGGKKVGYVFVHKVSNDWQKGYSHFDAAMACCNKWGVPIIDLTLLVPPFGLFPLGTDLYTNLRAIYTKNADGVHPNEQGYKKYYCDKIESWMKTL